MRHNMTTTNQQIYNIFTNIMIGIFLEVLNIDRYVIYLLGIKTLSYSC